ncbi:MAG: hypothetical protein ACPGSI_05145 [Pikeienuella sp.]
MTTTTFYQDFVSPAQRAGESEPDESEIRLARARGKARAAGFAEGVASAEASFDHEMKQQVGSLLEAMKTVSDNKRAVDHAALDAIRRIVNEVLSAFAPPMADAMLPTLVADRVAKAITSELDGEICVQVSPKRAAELRERLTTGDPRVTFTEAPDLSPSSARVVWRGGFDEINPRSAIQAGLDLLNERLRTTAKTSENKDIST